MSDELVTECWMWGGHIMPSGYGKSHGTSAHRVVYEGLVGPIPDGLTLDHLCLNKACVNPDHLEPVTIRENLLRSPKTWAGRNARKTHCPQGHEYRIYGANRNNQRWCMECQRVRALSWYHKHKERVA